MNPNIEKIIKFYAFKVFNLKKYKNAFCVFYVCSRIFETNEYEYLGDCQAALENYLFARKLYEKAKSTKTAKKLELLNDIQRIDILKKYY